MTYNQLKREDINNLLKDKKIEALEDYKNTKEKCTFKCLICGKEFINSYDNVRYWKGEGCTECTQKEKTLRKRKERLYSKKSDDVEILSYDTDIKRIRCKCLICDSIYDTTFNSLIAGCKHRPCAMKNLAQLTSKDDVLNIVSVYEHNISIDFSNYLSPEHLLKCRCNVCGNNWETKHKNILRGKGCPICAIEKSAISRRKPINQCYDVLNEFNLELIGEYSGISSPINVKCKKCGVEFSTSIGYLKNLKVGCVNCNNKHRTKQKRHAFIEKLIKINPHIHVNGIFLSMNDKIKLYCDQCEKTFYETPHDILRYHNCPNCTTNSVLEYVVVSFLNDHHIEFTLHKTYDKLYGINGGKLSYDFYLPKYNLLIECQGKQHDRPVEMFGGEEQFKIQQEHDKRKRAYAQEHRIDLLEIWYWDMDNIAQILSDKLNIGNDIKSA